MPIANQIGGTKGGTNSNLEILRNYEMLYKHRDKS